MAIIYTIIILFLLYSGLVLYFAWAWNALPEFVPTQPTVSTRISVIIPARNEGNNIGKLLRALEQQSFPADNVEIIVVDDHSTDNTAEIARSFSRVKLLQLKDEGINSYKKLAIQRGIEGSTGDLVVTTDADCVPGINWLQMISAFRQETDACFIAAPAAIDCDGSILQVFQAMDFMILQGITGASVYQKKLSMCNGANLPYDKKVFFEVNGFEGIDNIASGDDMLLMHKIAQRYPNRLGFLKSKEAIVSTEPMLNWKDFFNQRIRWASKATKYDDDRLFPVLLLVYLFNFSFILLFIIGIWDTFYLWALLILWVLKTLVELPLMITVTRFFNKEWAIKLLFIFQPLHILYTIISGLFGQFGKYQWKGRTVR